MTKSWAIYNPLQQFIHVAISAESDELRHSSPESQTIPPGSTAGFDIVLCSDKTGNMRKSISYTINGHHTNRFNMVAVVVPLNLEPDRTEINFRFPDDNLEMNMSETVMVTNPWPHAAEFMVEVQSTDPFTPGVLSGTVPPNGTYPFEIKFTPPASDKGANVRYTDEFVLNVTGGPPVQIQCIADFSPPKLEFAEPVVAFDVISVGLKAEQLLVLKNVGKSTVVYHVEPSVPEIAVDKLKGKISAGSKNELTVSLRLKGQVTFEESITIHIRGGKSITIPLKAESALPKVAFEEAEFDFGKVTCGDFGQLAGHLKNTGRLPCTVYIDFSEQANFAVQEDEAALKEGGFSESPISVVSSMDDDSDRPGTAMSVATDGSMTADAIQPQIYKIDIPRGGMVPFFFFFAPTEVKSYAFELPLCFAGIQGNDAAAPPKYVVAGDGLKPRIALSTNTADFGSKVVIKDRLKKAPYHVDVQITNEDVADVQWAIALDNMPNAEDGPPTFTLEPSEGVLGISDTKTIRICFVPEDDGSYEFKMPVYIDNDFSKRYLELTVKAQGRFPMITFDEDEVVLPVVPLGLQTSATFHILNAGHDSLISPHIPSYPQCRSRLPQLAVQTACRLGAHSPAVGVPRGPKPRHGQGEAPSASPVQLG